MDDQQGQAWDAPCPRLCALPWLKRYTQTVSSTQWALSVQGQDRLLHRSHTTLRQSLRTAQPTGPPSGASGDPALRPSPAGVIAAHTRAPWSSCRILHLDRAGRDQEWGADSRGQPLRPPVNPAGTEPGTRREPLDDSRQEDGPPSHRAQAVSELTLCLVSPCSLRLPRLTALLPWDSSRQLTQRPPSAEDTKGPVIRGPCREEPSGGGMHPVRSQMALR
ncbi:PREDICTED: uncharacterized protein LOC109380000 isoform X2 [Hipposideros armiger]|uniref:Uncharacterized protein LOC109380000 isoform X2 n=1 Tax=Hipposideros armiger TaxID=186990 RepID=A0A8B7QWJ7_HIPAR|nr:PREDICTED: uncharacterized protein LOC109380000 isoform X2 [Hipposideros armiger]